MLGLGIFFGFGVLGVWSPLGLGCGVFWIDDSRISKAQGKWLFAAGLGLSAKMLHEDEQHLNLKR